MCFSLSGWTSLPSSSSATQPQLPRGIKKSESPPGWGIHLALDRSPRCLWSYGWLMNKIIKQTRRPPWRGRILYSGEILTAVLEEGDSMGLWSWKMESRCWWWERAVSSGQDPGSSFFRAIVMAVARLTYRGHSQKNKCCSIMGVIFHLDIEGGEDTWANWRGSPSISPWKNTFFELSISILWETTDWEGNVPLSLYQN